MGRCIIVYIATTGFTEGYDGRVNNTQLVARVTPTATLSGIHLHRSRNR